HRQTPHISKGRASLASHSHHIPPSSRLSGRTAPSARQQTSRPTSWQFTALQLKKKKAVRSCLATNPSLHLKLRDPTLSHSNAARGVRVPPTSTLPDWASLHQVESLAEQRHPSKRG
ncbi:uncharacterized protein CLUP02_00839, partial [Colletotrichum lupini]